MNKDYNQIQSTFYSGGLVAKGLGIRVPPFLLQQKSVEQPSNFISGEIYQRGNNLPTYSYLFSTITGKYTRSTDKSKLLRIAPEVINFLDLSRISLKLFDGLLLALRNTYGNVRMDVDLHTDSEEGWVKPVITVYSEIEDFDKLLELEDDFFAQAANDSDLLTIINHIVVSQA